jgi:O-antigen/teichoic acid export membrane protein
MPVLTLLGLGKAREAAIVSFIIGTSNTVLALVLTPRYGRDGAGWALCLSMATGLLPLVWVHRLVNGAMRALLVTLLRLAPVAGLSALVTYGTLAALPKNLLATLSALGLGAATGLLAHTRLPGAPREDRDLLMRWRRQS